MKVGPASVERQAIAGLKWVGAAKLAAQVSSWAVTLVVVRLLVPGDYGLMALAWLVVSVAAAAAELGLGVSLVQARAFDRDQLARVAALALLLHLGMGLVVACGAPLAALFFGEPRLTAIVQVGALHFVLAAFTTIPEALVLRDMDFRRLSTADLVSALSGSLATLALAMAGAGVWSLVVGNLFAAALRSSLLMRGRFVRPQFRFDRIGRFAAFGGTLTTSRLVWQLTHQVDVLIAGRFLPQEAVGLYSMAVHLATLPMQKITSVVNQVALPAVARLQAERARLQLRLLTALRLMMLVAIPPLWCLAAVAPEFVSVVLGPRWSGIAYPLRVISLLVPLKIASSVISTSTVALGAAMLDFRNTMINLVVLPLAFLVGVQWGIDGLATAWVVGTGIVLGLTLPRMCPVVGVGLRQVVRAGAAPLIAGVALVVAVLALRPLLAGAAEPLRLAALILAGLAVYVAVVTLLEREVWEDVRRIVAAAKG